MDVQDEQLKVFRNLLRTGANTSYAKHLKLHADMTYEEFRARIPLSNYSNLEPWVNRIKNGENNVVWPGGVRRFAVSSGTTGVGKHIPISDDRLQSDITFMRRVVRHIIRDNPDPGLFLGKHVALSGSVENVDGFEFGEISGMLACATPQWIRLWQDLCPETSAYMNWADRFEAIIMNAMHTDIRMITGVPSWILILLREVSLRRGIPIAQVWPNLRLIVTGGVALSGYIDAIRCELGDLKIRFLENYGASEGYYAFDWYDSGSLLLQYDTSIYYEFLPVESSRNASIHSTNDAKNVLPLWEVKSNVRYGLVVTNNSGLWRYLTNDEIVFTSVNPPKIRVNGRLNEMTDAFGEAITASDVYSVIHKVMPNNSFKHVHLRSTWGGNPTLPKHEWICVVTDDDTRQSLNEGSTKLTHEVDQQLRSINRHYAIRRDTNAIGLPFIRIIGLAEYEIMIRSMPNSQSKMGLFLQGIRMD